MRVFRIHIDGYVRAFARPETTCDRVWLYLKGYRKNWVGPCFVKGRAIKYKGEK